MHTITRSISRVAVGLLPLSWLAALAVGGYVEYLGWHRVFDGQVAAGLAFAFLLAPAAFMATQTVVALPVAGMEALVDRRQRRERDEAAEILEAWDGVDVDPGQLDRITRRALKRAGRL